MDARGVDPRDLMWEAEPVFRVQYSWQGGAVSEEWELTGGDVDEALRWAESHAGDAEVPEVLLVVPAGDRGGKGAVRLRGHDPDAA